jgi:NADPH:quinone reductase-like Zn-dependent oxidoreductase
MMMNNSNQKNSPSSSENEMRCALIAEHGNDIEKVLSIGTKPKPERNPGELLLRIYSVALAPGDVRVMKGDCDLFQSPGTFPYIPGGDLAGVVEEADADSRFQKGDEVIAMFEPPRPLNALAEYAVVKEKFAEIKPTQISWMDAPCLTSSAVSAFFASKQYITEGSRILILGGSGGVGMFLIQFAKLANASFIATTSTEDESRLQALGADQVINYRLQDWWDIPEFEDSPFDVIFDLGVGNKDAWHVAKNYSMIKKRDGNFVTFSGHNPNPILQNYFQVVGMMANISTRMLTSRIWPYHPDYTWHMGLDLQPNTLKEIIKFVQTGQLKVEMDPLSPLPFTKEGLARGFQLMTARRAHGKVVVMIA